MIIHPLSLSFLKTNPFLLIRYCVSETALLWSIVSENITKWVMLFHLKKYRKAA